MTRMMRKRNTFPSPAVKHVKLHEDGDIRRPQNRARLRPNIVEMPLEKERFILNLAGPLEPSFNRSSGCTKVPSSIRHEIMVDLSATGC